VGIEKGAPPGFLLALTFVREQAGRQVSSAEETYSNPNSGFIMYDGGLYSDCLPYIRTF